MEYKIVHWVGRTGIEYQYEVLEFDYEFDSKIKGNYILATKNFSGKWIPLFIGEGLFQKKIHSEPNKTKALLKGVSHIHVCVNRNETNRLMEKKDLLNQHPFAKDHQLKSFKTRKTHYLFRREVQSLIKRLQLLF